MITVNVDKSDFVKLWHHKYTINSNMLKHFKLFYDPRDTVKIYNNYWLKSDISETHNVTEYVSMTMKENILGTGYIIWYKRHGMDKF